MGTTTKRVWILAPGVGMVNEAGGSVKKRPTPDSTRGSRSSPFNDVACFVVISISGVLFLFGARSFRLTPPGIAPTLGAKSKRISLVADMPSIIDPTSSGTAQAVLVVLSLVAGVKPRLAFPLQKNQLATSLPSCFCSARAGTSCSYCGVCLLLLLCRIESTCRASF